MASFTSAILFLLGSSVAVNALHVFQQKDIDQGAEIMKEFLQRENSEPSSDSWPPKFCNKLQCPKFKVIEKKKEYEVREYMVSHWVSTSEYGVDYDTASYKMFMRLFDYISGKNAKKQKIDMTCPVINKIQPGPGAACASNFTMSFFMHIDSIPAPSDKLVSDTALRKMTVYVRQFGGKPDIKEWLEEGVKLAKSLPQNAKYQKNYYYTAGYDSPFKLLNRHNEIWFIKK